MTKINWQFLPAATKVRTLREKRTSLEYRLKRCWIPDTRDTYMLQIEIINIRLQMMGEGKRGNKHKATF